MVVLFPLFGMGIGVAVDSPLSRGKAIEMMVDYFDLEAQNQSFLHDCKLDPGTCLFAFSARTNFDDFRLDPLILYPDVYPAYRYYEAINVASMLDLASGYYMEADSPFRPEQPITKVETLKLVMGASGLMDWKEKFELSLQDQSWRTVGTAKDGGMAAIWPLPSVKDLLIKSLRRKRKVQFLKRNC